MTQTVRVRSSNSVDARLLLLDLLTEANPARLALRRVAGDVAVVDVLSDTVLGTIPPGHPVARARSLDELRVSAYSVIGNSQRPLASYLSITVESEVAV